MEVERRYQFPGWQLAVSSVESSRYLFAIPVIYIYIYIYMCVCVCVCVFVLFLKIC